MDPKQWLAPPVANDASGSRTNAPYIAILALHHYFWHKRDNNSYQVTGMTTADDSIKNMFPLVKLFFTDLLSGTRDCTVDHNQHTKWTSEELHKTLVAKTAENVEKLHAAGAVGPLFGISGFETQSTEEREGKRDFGKLLASNLEWGLVFWGSPHFADSNWDLCHGCKETTTSEDFKSSSFESMAYLAPRAFIMMTFSAKYKLEFWHPLYNKSKGRHLVITKGYARQYRPIGSGRNYRCLAQTTMVAMLVPYKLMKCIEYFDDGMDIGKTLLNIVDQLGPSERAIELGGQDFSMSAEILLSHRFGKLWIKPHE